MSRCSGGLRSSAVAAVCDRRVWAFRITPGRSMQPVGLAIEGGVEAALSEGRAAFCEESGVGGTCSGREPPVGVWKPEIRISKQIRIRREKEQKGEKERIGRPKSDSHFLDFPRFLLIRICFGFRHSNFGFTRPWTVIDRRYSCYSYGLRPPLPGESCY